jgi:hypothetical protein
MSASQLETLLPLLDVAAFLRHSDGSFSSISQPPAWFERLTSDATFPFLGHILEEANAFWQRGLQGAVDYGPCAEVDDNGKEYHYLVTAVSGPSAQYLVFQIDRGADRMRGILQKLRSEALSAAQDGVAYQAVIADLRETNQEVKELLRRLLLAGLNPTQLEMVNQLASRCVNLMAGATELVRATNIPKM